MAPIEANDVRAARGSTTSRCPSTVRPSAVNTATARASSAPSPTFFATRVLGASIAGGAVIAASTGLGAPPSSDWKYAVSGFVSGRSSHAQAHARSTTPPIGVDVIITHAARATDTRSRSPRGLTFTALTATTAPSASPRSASRRRR